MGKKKSIIPGFVKNVVWLLQTVFLVLRACDVVSWPWYALLAPLGLYLVVLLLCVVIIGIGAVKGDP